MTDLEHRALLGDRIAQEECTKKWIVLACPFCGDGSAVSFIETDEQPYANHIQGFVLCRSCGFSSAVFLSRKIALSKWNTRPAPPINRSVDRLNCEKDNWDNQYLSKSEICDELRKIANGYGACCAVDKESAVLYCINRLMTYMGEQNNADQKLYDENRRL